MESVYPKLCRTCVKILHKTDNMYDLHDKSLKLIEMLTLCTNIKVLKNDNISSSICEECIKCLKAAFEFKRTAEASDQHLRKICSLAKSDVSFSEQELFFESDLSCPKCKRKFQDFEQLLDHEKEHVNTNKEVDCPKPKKHTNLKAKYTCDLCSKTFTQSSSLNIHLKRHRGEKHYKCKLCPKSFITNNELNVHNYVHNGIRQFKCQECEKCFPTSDSLKKHMRRHNGDKPHLCAICGKGFAASNTLQVHIRTHSGEKPLQCPKCTKCFAAHGSLTLHLRKHNEERPFLCSYCGKTFKSSSDLKIHGRKHTGEHPYPCDMCDKKFRTSYAKMIHLRCHTGEKPVKCDFCEKCFISNGHLKVHLKTHISNKPYKCKECSKAFATIDDLNVHNMIHNNEKPHTCSKCGKGFNRKNNLVKHMKLHLGLKPRASDACKSSVTTRPQLKEPLSALSHQRLFTCEECEKKFISESDLKKHKLQEHKAKKKIEKNVNVVENGTFKNKCVVQNHSNLVLYTNPSVICLETRQNIQSIVQTNDIIDYTLGSLQLNTVTMRANTCKIDKIPGLIPLASKVGDPSLTTVLLPINNSFTCENNYVQILTEMNN